MKYLSIIITAPLLFSLSACGTNSSDLLSEACVEQGMVQEMKGMEESDRKSVKVGVVKACEMFVTECEKKPDGEMCVAIKKKFGVEGE